MKRKSKLNRPQRMNNFAHAINTKTNDSKVYDKDQGLYYKLLKEEYIVMVTLA